MKPIKEFKVDKLNVVVYKTREEMGQAAYELYKERILNMLKKKDSVRTIFAAAPSQNDFLKALAADKSLDFSKIEAFHMDEYIGLNAEAPQRFGNFLKRAIFSKQPFARVNYINSSEMDTTKESSRYEALLRTKPMDIVSMGIGENGHIAFNDPHEANFNDPKWVKPVSLDIVCRQQQVNDGEFATLKDVPLKAMTLTIPALCSCESIVCIVPNERKAEAVKLTLTGPIAESCPASILRKHDDATLLLDADAAKYIL